MKWTFGVLLVAACGFAQAAEVKGASSTCDALATAFDGGLKNMSAIAAMGLGDNSAARESNRQLEKVVETNLMQMNLSLLQLNKCPTPREPVIDSIYYLDALKCANAMTRAQSSGDKATPPECDRSKWVKMGSANK